jgi:hypothetical protein
LNKKIVQDFNSSIKAYFFSDNVHEKKALLLSIENMLEKNELLSAKENKFIFKKRKDTLIPLSLALFYSDKALFDLFLKYTPIHVLEQKQTEIIDSLFNYKFRTHPHLARKITRSEETSSYFFNSLLKHCPTFFSSMKDSTFLNIFSRHLYLGEFEYKIDLEFFKDHYLNIYSQLDTQNQYEHNIFYILSNHAECVFYMLFDEKYDMLFDTFSSLDLNCIDKEGNNALMNAIIHRNFGFAYVLTNQNNSTVDCSIFNYKNEDFLTLLCHKVNQYFLHTEYKELSHLLNYTINHTEYIILSLDYAQTVFYEQEQTLYLKDKFLSLFEKYNLETQLPSLTFKNKKHKI